jgi:Mor family transcriptional regulator
MGKVPEEETVRNQQIYKDFKSGASYVYLVSKYRISSQRVWQIVKREEKRNE